MPLPDCEVACRLLQAIVEAPAPWSNAVAILIVEAETSGPAKANAALAWLEQHGWIARWMPPPSPSDEDGKGGKTDVMAVLLTPWALEQMASVMLGERYELEIVENATASRAWYDFSANQPQSYRLPKGDRLPSISDPRMAATVASLSVTEDEDDEGDVQYLADHRGEIVELFGRPVAVTESWGAAARADEAARAKRLGRKDRVA